MQTIRRLYLYLVALVSLEVVLWGAIGLARSILGGEQIGGNVSRLAGALSLILVGIPVFLLHWALAQRGAAQDDEERFARIRAVFLYATLGATLVPAVQNGLAVLSRAVLRSLGTASSQALFGGGQSLVDNLTAIFLNLLIAAYIYTVLRRDWQKPPQGEAFPETRRFYRYLWMLYGLAMVVFGVQQLLQFALSQTGAVGSGVRALLANGLALLFVGVPLWVFVWQRIQRVQGEVDEARSMVRLVVLYLLAFISVGTVLSSTAVVLYVSLRLILGEALTFRAVLGEISGPLSAAIPFGAVWAYFGGKLGENIRSLRRPVMEAEPAEEDRIAPRRAALRRLYFYVLSAAGLGAAFIGLQMLLAFLLDLGLRTTTVWGGALRNNLAAALATLLVGTPLWILAWRPMVGEASIEGEAGDHARRSLVRKGYLYLLLFVGVMGVMSSAGVLVFQLLSTLLGEPPDNLLLESMQLLKVLLLFVIFLVYHWQALRADNRWAERSLARRHAQYPVLVIDLEEGQFTEQVVGALEKEVVELPIAVHPSSQGAPDTTLSAARAVIIPAQVLAKPSEALRLWLQGFSGVRVVVPTPASGWHWIFGSGRTLPTLVRRTAQIVRHLAEGEDLPAPRDSSPWTVILYIFGVLFLAEIVLMLISLGLSFIFR